MAQVPTPPICASGLHSHRWPEWIDSAQAAARAVVLDGYSVQIWESVSPCLTYFRAVHGALHVSATPHLAAFERNFRHMTAALLQRDAAEYVHFQLY